MKKTSFVIAIASLVILLGGVWTWSTWTESSPVPDSPISASVGPEEPEEASRVAARPGDAERVDVAGGGSVGNGPSTGAYLRLLDGNSGEPIASIPYWRDERPFHTHPGRAPEGAARTDARGRFTLDAATGDGDFLWFEMYDSWSIAIPDDALTASTSVRLPSTRDVTVGIRGLPSGETWRILACPAWLDEEGEVQHAWRSWVTPPDPESVVNGELPIWIARRRWDIGGDGGVAEATFSLIEHVPVTFYCSADHFLIEPDVLNFRLPPASVVAHVSESLSAYGFEVLEPGGSVRSPIDGNAMIVRGFIRSTTAFSHGRGEITWQPSRSRDGAVLLVVLPDGTYFREDLSSPRFGRSQELRFERGRGITSNRLRLAFADAELAERPWLAAYVGVAGRTTQATVFENFVPEPPPDEVRVGAWQHEGDLVVASSGTGELSNVYLIGPRGRVVHRVGDRIEPMPSISLESLDPTALIDTWEDAGATSIVVELMAKLPGTPGPAPGGRTLIRRVMLFSVDGFGWRYSANRTRPVHEAVPAEIELLAPDVPELCFRCYARGPGMWQDFEIPVRRLR